MQTTFSKVRSIVGSQHKISVGDRLQANQEDETILTHSSHTWESAIPDPQFVHTHTLQIITFSKSYIQAADRCDAIFDGLRDASTTVTGGDMTGAVISWYPVSQTMYYTDSDDFACVVTVKATFSL